MYAYHLGCRRGELLALKRFDVDLKALTVRFSGRTTKNQEAKVAPIFGDMIACTQMGARGAGKVSELSMVIPQVRKTHQQFQEGLGRCLRSGRRRRLAFHDLRRSAVKNMEDAGVPRKTAMQITWHKTESIYRRYHIVSDRDIRDAGIKLARFLGERETGNRMLVQ